MPSVFVTHTNRTEPNLYGFASTLTQRQSSKSACKYIFFGETFVDQQNGYDARYTFSAKEKDDETSYVYFGQRYYDSDLSVWLSVDPMSDGRPNLTPYHYCQNNPIMRVDPNGMWDDNYTFDEVTGTVSCQRTNDNTDSFYYKNSDGTTEHLGTYNKETTTTTNSGEKVGVVKLPKNGDDYKTTGTERTYIRSDMAAAILGVAHKFNKKYGQYLQITQLNKQNSGHSASNSYNWSGADIRYVNNKGNVDEPVSTAGSNVDFAKSQDLVNMFINAGISYIGTENAAGNGPAFTGTSWPGKGPDGTWEHQSHMHLKNMSNIPFSIRAGQNDKTVPRTSPQP
jgi:RHS repeat-associated protein